MTTLQIYSLLLVLLPILYGIERLKVLPRMLYNVLFILIAAFCVFRYDTTTDYMNYVEIFVRTRRGDELTSEAGYTYLNSLFTQWHFGYIGVFAVCSLICIYSFHRIFRRHNIVYWGWFFSITLLVVFMMNNQIRQAVSIALTVLALPYLEKKQPLRYGLFIALAFTIHYSALICIPYYFVAPFFKSSRIGKDVWFILLGLATGLYFMGFYYDYTVELFRLIPRYDHYLKNDLYTEKEQIKTSFGILLILALGVFIILNKDKVDEKYKMHINMAILYFFLFIVFSDLRIVQRLANFLLIFVIIALSKIMQERKVFIVYKIAIVFSCLVWWGRKSYLNDRPYLTVFSEERSNYIFYEREWGSKKSPRELHDTRLYKY